MKLHEKLYTIMQPLVSAVAPEEAIPVLEKTVQTWPDMAMVHNDLGVLYYNAGSKDKALERYETSVGLQPDNAVFLKNLADFYYVEQGRIEEALQIYMKVLEKNPEDLETIQVTGHICVSVRRFDDARIFYRRALEIEPWNPEVRESLDKLENMIPQETAFDSPDHMYQDIQEHMASESPKKAIDDLTKLLQQWPDYGIAHNDLGVLYYDTGEKGKALEHYEQAVKHQPSNNVFQKNLADFYYVEQGRTEDALKGYIKVLERSPEDIETLLATGRICEELNKKEDARVFYKKVLEIEPWNSEAIELMGMDEY